jgi:hypothetical protein
VSRPTAPLRARAAPGFARLRQALRSASSAPGLANAAPPAWAILTVREDPASSTALRAAAQTKNV